MQDIPNIETPQKSYKRGAEFHWQKGYPLALIDPIKDRYYHPIKLRYCYIVETRPGAPENATIGLVQAITFNSRNNEPGSI